MPKKKKHKQSIYAPLMQGMQPILSQLLAPDKKLLANQVEARTSLGKALAGVYKGVSPAVSRAYDQAAQTTLGAGAAFSGSLRDTLASNDADLAAYLDKIAPGSAQVATPGGAAADALYGSAGYIPGTSLSREGAAAGAAAARLPATAAGQTAVDVGRIQREGIAALMAKRAELIPSLMQIGIQEQAQNLYGRQFREEKRQNKREFKLAVAGLKLQQAQEARMLQGMVQDGLQIDSSASRVLGYVVDKNGNPVLNKHGDRIKVADSASKGDKKKAFQSAVGDAKDLRGDPIQNQNQGPAAPGQYIAAPGAKGVFQGGGGFPATTNDPNKARWDTKMPFGQAIQFLSKHYGISRKRARAALVAAGWPIPSGFHSGAGGHVGGDGPTHH
jgi:hypothetical protein